MLPLLQQPELVYILEEGVKSGGIGEKLAAAIAQDEQINPGKLRIRAIENPLMEQGDLTSLYDCCGFLPGQIATEIAKIVEKKTA